MDMPVAVAPLAARRGPYQASPPSWCGPPIGLTLAAAGALGSQG
jgi:hypothetical protein